MKKIIFRNFSIAVLAFLIVYIVSSCIKGPELTEPPDLPGPSNLPDSTFYNASYGADSKHTYDAYLPAGRDTQTPVLILIHGGAWKAGQKEDFTSYVSVIRSKWKNVAIINMNYRLASNANSIHHDEIMDDIHTLLRHLDSNKRNFQMSYRTALLGASAGGQLAMIYSYKYNHLHNIKTVGNIFGPSFINDWSWYNSTNIWLGGNVGDILTEYVGQPWDSAVYSGVSPYWQVTSSIQPTIIFHGNLDPIVPVYQSQWMRSRLTSNNVPNEYYEYTAFHSFDAAQTQDVVRKMVAFFKKHI